MIVKTYGELLDILKSFTENELEQDIEFGADTIGDKPSGMWLSPHVKIKRVHRTHHGWPPAIGLISLNDDGKEGLVELRRHEKEIPHIHGDTSLDEELL